MNEQLAQQALGAWQLGDVEHISSLSIGNINSTFVVQSHAGKFILQRLHEIFDPVIHEDIEAVTQHLKAKGWSVPMLVRTTSEALCSKTETGVWRVMTFVEGRNFSSAADPDVALHAGELLGRFHRDVGDLQYTFKNPRPLAHNTAAHMAKLQETVATYAQHPRFEAVHPVAREIIARYQDLQPVAQKPSQNVHGDPKLNNLLFDETGHGICLVDLDTLGRMNPLLELGDAFRSWCNPTGEDDERSAFHRANFEAAVKGYRQSADDAGRELTDDEMLGATATIALELSARFCADALCEDYFGWDQSRFERACDHHLLRAKGQLHLATSVLSLLG